MSSPSSQDVLRTPMNTVFYGLEGFEGVKEGCEGEVQSENLAGGDWARCGSPPMTPGKFEMWIRLIRRVHWPSCLYVHEMAEFILTDAF